MRKKIKIYTDGACSGNPGPGGWGAILVHGKTEKELCGGEGDTTNNRMEMMAVIKALGALKQHCDVELYTDSTYVIKGMTQWLEGWKAKGWKTANRKPVKNSDLWQLLETAVEPHNIQWHWVKGHNGHEMNERADELARKGIETIY